MLSMVSSIYSLGMRCPAITSISEHAISSTLEHCVNDSYRSNIVDIDFKVYKYWLTVRKGTKKSELLL